MTHSPSNIAIIGAGITGLTLAFALKKKYGDHISLTIFEKESRPGGWIKTAWHGKALFEWGARSIRRHEAERFFELVESLGLSSELITASETARQRYILKAGKLEPLPASIWGLLTSPLTRPALKSLLTEIFVPASRNEDESVYAFFSRRFSPYVADCFIDALVKGIFAGDPKQLSMKACFPQILEMEKTSGSLLLGTLKNTIKGKKKKAGMVTLQRGLESLVEALAASLQKELFLNTPIEKLEFSATGAIINESKTYDQVISALPAYNLASVLPQCSLKSALQQIPFASVGVVHLGFQSKVNPYPGFGYLVPASEQEPILGVVFDSSAFPLQNASDIQTRMTVMINGDCDPAKMKEIAKKGIKKHLGITDRPLIEEAAFMSRCIPQYPVGFSHLLDKINQAKKGFPQLHLLGTSFGEISISRAIRSAMDFACQSNFLKTIT